MYRPLKQYLRLYQEELFGMAAGASSAITAIGSIVYGVKENEPSSYIIALLASIFSLSVSRTYIREFSNKKGKLKELEEIIMTEGLSDRLLKLCSVDYETTRMASMLWEQHYSPMQRQRFAEELLEYQKTLSHG
jgi:hypothetical protein